MAHPPFVLESGKDDDCMELGDEGHELTADAGIEEHRGDFVLELKTFIDFILLVIDRSKVDDIFFDEDPLVLLDRESINQIQLSRVLTQLDILHDLSSQIDEVDLILPQPYNIRFSFFFLLQEGNTIEVQIFIDFVLGERKPMMHDGPILF